MGELLEVALEWFTSGYPVIAIGSHKHPYRRGWNRFFIESQTEEEARNEFKNGAWGIAGILHPGSNYVHLDFDGKHARDAWKQTGVALPETARNITQSGGEHLVFRASKLLRESEIRVKRKVRLVEIDCGCVDKGGAKHNCGVDLLLNGIAVLPGSPNYREDADHPFESAVEIPDEIIKLALAKQAQEKKSGGKTGDDNGRVNQGKRKVTACSLAGSMRTRGMSIDAIRAALKADNEARFDPPLDDAEIEDVLKSAATWEQGGEPEDPEKELPALDAGNHDLKAITDATLKVLIAANDPPFLFRHAESVARVQNADDGAVTIRIMSEDALRHVLSRVAWWYTKKKKKVTADLPPRHVAKDILAMPSPPFPIITRIVHAPIFAANGSLCVHRGYNESARIYYDPDPGFTVNPISSNPAPDEIALAVDTLEDMLCDFPFVGDAEKAHILALMLLPFARELIESPTPLHLIEKPSPGTGASLLADVVLYPALGRRIAILAEGRDDDEWRKRITAKLIGGASVVLIDNVRRRLESSSLSAAITSPTWEDRILGHSQMVNIPVRCAWLATGNNPALSNEITRRTIRIRLDAKTDRPWLRTEFKHADLRAWVNEHRAEIVHAALTLIQAWIANGRPEFSAVTFGMFESWCRVMGGILEVAGVKGFLSNLNAFYDASDTEAEAWRAFVAQWWETHHDQQVGASALFKIVAPEDGDPIDIDLGKGSDRSQRTKLGIALNRMRDRRFDNRCIVKGGTKQRAQMWTLKEV